MRVTFLTATLAAVAGVSALPAPQEQPDTGKNAQPLPLAIFAETHVEPISLEVAAAKYREVSSTPPQTGETDTNNEVFRVTGLNDAAGTCSSVRVRTEWDSYSNSDRQAFIDAIKCLMGRAPNGQFSKSKSRYEDFVALHQLLTPNVHSSAKFLIWHRYFTWTFEDVLRSECGFNRAMPWFDETRYAGRFAQSSIFSSQWFGSINTGGNCVTDGQFANLALNIGPGSTDQLHCLSRDNDDSKTANCNQAYVDQCNAWDNYADMASCAETGPHAWGHNGIGAVMLDVWGSPSDPVFWLHHAFVDRAFRIWQNANSARVSTINGNDKAGNPLTLDTTVNVYDFRPTVKIRDILDTTGPTLCYRYNY
ncbi:hypothetical protein ACN47E_000105 [Coniothyrium glycines]